MRKSISLRFKNHSLFLQTKALIVIGAAAILFLFTLVLSVGIGDMMMTPLEVIRALTGSGSEIQQLVVTNFRLPRALLAALAGMSLAVSGAILQGISRNPLASPDIIGVTGGASLFVAAFLTVFTTADNALVVSLQWLPLAAFAGALLAGFAVFLLAQKNGLSRIRFILIGVGFAAGTRALTDFLLIIGPVYLASRATIWMTGSVHGATWEQVATLFVWFILFAFVTLIYARRLNVQELGFAVASGVGSRVHRDRNVLLILGTALTGGAVAFAGGIGFAGLIAPHMARRLVGPQHGALIPACALIGGIIVMGADLLGRTLFLPLEVPAGVFTAAIGAPYFIYLLYKTRHQ